MLLRGCWKKNCLTRMFRRSINGGTHSIGEALQGLSTGDAVKLKEAFGVDTIGELAELKYFRWARAIAISAEVEE